MADLRLKGVLSSDPYVSPLLMGNERASIAGMGERDPRMQNFHQLPGNVNNPMGGPKLMQGGDASISMLLGQMQAALAPAGNVGSNVAGHIFPSLEPWIDRRLGKGATQTLRNILPSMNEQQREVVLSIINSAREDYMNEEGARHHTQSGILR